MPLLLTLMLLSTGCQRADGSSICRVLPLVEYPHDRSVIIGGQIKAAPAELQRFALDAVELRDAVRACRS